MTTFRLNDQDELVGDDGLVLGRVVALELDGRSALVSIEIEQAGESSEAQLELLGPRRGLLENGNDPTATSKAKNPPTGGKNLDVEAVWAFYQQVIPNKRKLGPKQRRDIERALEVSDLDTIKLALIGLSHSPWHNGQNDDGTRYLDIRYALRGNVQKGESHDERIDRMAEKGRAAAGASSPAQSRVKDRGVLQARVDARMRQIQANISPAVYGEDWDQEVRDDHDRHRSQKVTEAIEQLREMGIRTLLLNGRATFEDIQ